MKIDFVIPWVDGSDPEWIRLRNQYCKSPQDVDECRFRDWDILKYWFRAVETYAPWVHRIYFITCGQVPSWLNTSHPKLRFVKHEDYIPQEYLPTFSSHVIELNLHRIPDLSEHFVYFNDDMFLNATVKQTDFFRNGLPCDTAVLCSFTPHDVANPYTHAVCNVMAYINQHFDKKSVIKQNPNLWFTMHYGKHILKNIYFLPTKFFSNLQNGHIPSSMLKSTFQTVWDLEPQLLHDTCMNRFRSLNDVNQYIMTYHNICSGKIYPRSFHFGKCYSIGRDSKAMHEDILMRRHKTICINDNPNVTDMLQEKETLIDIFSRKLPNKSSYEK